MQARSRLQVRFPTRGAAGLDLSHQLVHQLVVGSDGCVGQVRMEQDASFSTFALVLLLLWNVAS